jgi:murein DD-endopeptidase MepM/ murein hydrolase activator NlpD
MKIRAIRIQRSSLSNHWKYGLHEFKWLPLICLLLILLISGCSTAPQIQATPIHPEIPTSTLSPSSTATQVPITSTPTQILPQVCSPLQGFDFQELAGIVTDPFQPPLPGKDDGHQGVDFSFWTYKNFSTMQGLPVQAVLTGKVAAVINNRYPYGNMVIIESPLSAFPAAWLSVTPSPTREAIQTPAPALTCPSGKDNFTATSTELSLYLLYAHLDQPANLKVGDTVFCGQVIGGVGTTGKSVNYHLHLEMRIGPSSATFPVMAHYWNDATNEEMHNYCMWRVSGIFQMLDPMQLFQTSP